MQDLEQRVALLKSAIAVADPRQAPDWLFEREVDNLIDGFYDDIGTIIQVPLRSLFDLFLIKVMYVGRGARDHQVLDYLSEMLNRFLLSREMMRFNQVRYDLLLSILDEMNERRRFQNLFEASRQMADNALFITGVFPESRPGRRRRYPRPPRIDRTHFIELGRRYYRVAAEEDLAAVVGQRDVLMRLADHLPFYVETLSELSRRYILGFDMEVVANKMLDAFNRYRETGAQEHMENARKYAALLKVDRSFTGLHRPRARIINLPNLGSA
ncbi:MAG TPA: hypothetical protein VJB57_20125 [Dehalococcoidia bacterium]|nr:hypothetical protein [Dehalococcoidia bacterium]